MKINEAQKINTTENLQPNKGFISKDDSVCSEMLDQLQELYFSKENI